MCDYGRLNYKWIGRGDRLLEVRGQEPEIRCPLIRYSWRKAASRWRTAKWTSVLGEITEKLSARLRFGRNRGVGTADNEELYLLFKLARSWAL